MVQAGSTRRGSSRSLGGMSGKSGKQSAQSVTKGTGRLFTLRFLSLVSYLGLHVVPSRSTPVPFKMSIIRPGLDGSPVTTGFAVWSSTTVAVYDLPFALVDPLDDGTTVTLFYRLLRTKFYRHVIDLS